MKKLMQLARRMNLAWGHVRQNVPKTMDPYDVEQFTQSILAYSQEITDLERKRDLSGTSEMLSEMFLFLLCYIDRKGIGPAFDKMVDACCHDIIMSIEKNKKDKGVIIELEDGTVLEGPRKATLREDIDRILANHIHNQYRYK